MQALNGMLVMIGMGALGTALRDFASGHGERTRERSAGKWVVDSIDRSGILSLYMEFDQLSGKLTGMSPANAIAGEAPSRFAARGLAGQALGPSFGLATDLATTTRGVVEDEFTQSELHKIRRLLPGQNVFYTSWLFDQLEKGISESANLPETEGD
jgi:hypothetical protein